MAPRPYTEQLAFLANSQPHQPQATPTSFGPGGFLTPFNNLQTLWPTAFYWGVLVIIGILGLFRPSMAHGSWDTSCPFWPKYNEDKRGQGGRPMGPSAPFCSTNHKGSKWAKNLNKTSLEINPQCEIHGLWQ
ncbi:hypothetical protein O181_126544 [Austropuccinia psidii MF-1]|uniref:Uncharacterized protein n=1 Tax=Austropuccinia psidii MF-1 TaxID=1389203 RepID=A0A9Q3KTK0_9BASI|nr:hypothetical protein [Austropuccinia psidii MF-1]